MKPLDSNTAAVIDSMHRVCDFPRRHISAIAEIERRYADESAYHDAGLDKLADDMVTGDDLNVAQLLSRDIASVTDFIMPDPPQTSGCQFTSAELQARQDRNAGGAEHDSNNNA